MSDATITLTGWVASEPRHFDPQEGTPFTTFRIARTRRYRNEDNEWVDGRTSWFTVKTWRDAARNVGSSIRKGDPVVVHGRVGIDEWDGPDGRRAGLVLEALALGHDLAWGETRFVRTVHPRAGARGGIGSLVEGSAGDAGDEGRSDAAVLSGLAPDPGADPWESPVDGVAAEESTPATAAPA